MTRSLPTDLFWHYTDARGFIGITERCEVWATHLDFLNDRTEGVHGVTLLGALFERIAPFLGETQITESLEKQRLHPLPRAETMVFAMSKAADRLDSWRAYASGGMGYSFGFRAHAFPTSRTVLVRQCLYVDPDERTDWQALAERFEREMKGEWSMGSLARFAVRVAPLLKHISFKEEDEHRLIVYDPTPASVKVRLNGRGSRLVPYVPVPFDARILEAVCLGPGLTDADERVARSHLDNTPFGHVKLYRSRVPLQAV